MLTKIHIKNYRVFEDFSLEFSAGVNILVGDNDCGKTTLLEAVRLALTGNLGDKWLARVLSPHLFNQTASKRYVDAIQAGANAPLPELIIDLYLEAGDETAALKGTNNTTHEDVAGLRVKASFNKSYASEYDAFIKDVNAVTLIPTEYYQVEWLSFAGNPVTGRSVPASVSRIDASAIKLRSGADYYLQQIISDHLDPVERVELSRAYRSLREQFSANPAIATINRTLAQTQSEITDRNLSLSIDISQRTAWESSLIPHLDELPFQYVGNGSQNILKILLALNRSVTDAHVVLVEEPENHLSPASLNALVGKIAERCGDKLVLVTTHSSYVLNKLGLDRLVLIHDQSSMRLSDLPPATLAYFKKLSGYDTLRVVLSSHVVLVEGPSDELLVQRAFLDKHGKLPIEAGIDVLNVRGLSAQRFLDIAKPLGKRVSVVTDNDGKTQEEVADRFAEYTEGAAITVHTGASDSGKTLEPQVISVNGLELLNSILGKDYKAEEELEHYMTRNKTEWALAVFESQQAITMPSYIVDALES